MIAAARRSPDGSAEHAMALARSTLRRMMLHDHPDLDDLRGAAYLGAAKALARFDPTRGVQFVTYAIACIRGEILEELRRGDWLTRRDRHTLRALLAEAERHEAAGRRPPGYTRPARVWMTPESLEAVLPTEGEMDDVTVADTLLAPDDPPREALERAEARRLWASVARLPAMERRVMQMLYRDGLEWKETARRLGRSETRVGQLHRQALARLRLWWAAALEEEEESECEEPRPRR